MPLQNRQGYDMMKKRRMGGMPYDGTEAAGHDRWSLGGAGDPSGGGGTGRDPGPSGGTLFSAGISSAQFSLYGSDGRLGRVPGAAHCTDPGSAVSFGDRPAVRPLAGHPNGEILLRGQPCRCSLSLVRVLFSHALPAAAGSFCVPFPGAAGKLSFAPMDSPVVCTRCGATCAGADQ